MVKCVYKLCLSTACTIWGYRFYNMDCEHNQKIQNYDVLVQKIPETEDIDYYSVICDIIGLKYLGGNVTYVSKCEWWDLVGGWVSYIGIVTLRVSLLLLNDT